MNTKTPSYTQTLWAFAGCAFNGGNLDKLAVELIERGYRESHVYRIYEEHFGASRHDLNWVYDQTAGKISNHN